MNNRLRPYLVMGGGFPHCISHGIVGAARECGMDTKARIYSVGNHLAARVFLQLAHAFSLNGVCNWLKIKARAVAGSTCGILEVLSLILRRVALSGISGHAGIMAHDPEPEESGRTYSLFFVANLQRCHGHDHRGRARAFSDS